MKEGRGELPNIKWHDNKAVDGFSKRTLRLFLFICWLSGFITLIFLYYLFSPSLYGIIWATIALTIIIPPSYYLTIRDVFFTFYFDHSGIKIKYDNGKINSIKWKKVKKIDHDQKCVRIWKGKLGIDCIDILTNKKNIDSIVKLYNESKSNSDY